MCVHKYALPINMLVHNGQTRELESVWQPDIAMPGGPGEKHFKILMQQFKADLNNISILC